MKKKLLYVYYGDVESGNTAIVSRIKALLPYVGESFDITLYSTKPSNATVSNTDWYKHKFVGRNLLGWLLLLGKSLTHILSLFKSTLWILKAAKDFDLIVLYQPRLVHSLHVLVLAKLNGTKTVVEVTELESSREGRPGRIGKLEEKTYLKYTDAFVGITDKLLSQVNKHGRPQFVAPIVANESLRPKKFYAENTLLYVGSFAKKDNPLFVIKAFESCLLTFPDLELLMVGEGEELKRCRKYVVQQGLELYVTLPGSVPYYQVTELFKMADTLVLNRSNTAYANWGYPTKLADYMRTGIPVICSRIDALKTLPEDVAYFYEPNDEKSFRMAVRKRYTDENFVDVAKAAGRYAKTHFNARQTGLGLNNFLQSLCES